MVSLIVEDDEILQILECLKRATAQVAARRQPRPRRPAGSAAAAVSAASRPRPAIPTAGTLPAGRITKVADPDTWFDGTRGIFSFEMPTNAVSADIWLSQFADGRGALRQGRGFKQSPARVERFLANTEFHAFLVGSCVAIGYVVVRDELRWRDGR